MDCGIFVFQVLWITLRGTVQFRWSPPGGCTCRWCEAAPRSLTDCPHWYCTTLSVCVCAVCSESRGPGRSATDDKELLALMPPVDGRGHAYPCTY